MDNLFATFPSIDPVYFFATLFYLAGLSCFLFRQGKISFYLVLTGFGLHTFFLLNRAWLPGFFVPNALFENLYFLPWCLTFIYLGHHRFSTNRTLLDSFIVLILVFSLVPFCFPRGIIPPFPKSLSLFTVFFFFFEGLAQACFILGAWVGLLFFRKKDGSHSFHSFLLWGFVFYSIAQVVGAYWSYLGWATPLNWSYRHLQSASLWCFYAAILHLRYLPDWKLRQEALFSILGFFLVVLFNLGALLSERAIPRLGG